MFIEYNLIFNFDTIQLIKYNGIKIKKTKRWNLITNEVILYGNFLFIIFMEYINIFMKFFWLKLDWIIFENRTKHIILFKSFTYLIIIINNILFFIY